MEISELVTANAVFASLKATSKKQALQELARRASELTGEQERAIFDVLLERERLGTTGVGDGVAIPHGKLPNLKKLVGVFARLERPIDFVRPFRFGSVTITKATQIFVRAEIELHGIRRLPSCTWIRSDPCISR